MASLIESGSGGRGEGRRRLLAVEGVLRFLIRTDTPLWVTLVGFTAGAFGVYHVTPEINRRMEAQRIKTEYVIRSLDHLNTRTQELFSELTIANRKLGNGEASFGQHVDHAVRLASELQWRSIEISAVLDDSESLAVLARFQDGLDRLRGSIEAVKTPDTGAQALAAARAFIPGSMALANRIAALSGIRFGP